VAAAFDRIAPAFATGQARRLDVERVLTLAEPHEDDCALDVATGTGVVARALAEAARCVVGVDISAGMLRIADRDAQECRHRPVFARAPADALPFVDESFDLATCCRALHHMEQPRSAIAELARVVRRGGRIVLVDNVTYEDAAWAAWHNEVERIRDPSHAEALSLSRLTAMADGSGLEIVSAETSETLRPVRQWLDDAGADETVADGLVAQIAEGRAEGSSARGGFLRSHFAEVDGEWVFHAQMAWLKALRR
jgi:SAM-dependent methyltransferase